MPRRTAPLLPAYRLYRWDGARALAVRQARGLSRAQVFSATGIGPQNLVRWEKGDLEPRLGEALALAAVLQVSVEYFLSGGGEEE